MVKKQLHITSKRVLDFISLCVPEKKFGIDSDKAFCAQVDYPANNFPAIKSGNASFTLPQLERIAKEYSLDMNWVFGFSDKMYRGKQKTTALQQLQQSVKIIEEMLKEQPQK